MHSNTIESMSKIIRSGESQRNQDEDIAKLSQKLLKVTELEKAEDQVYKIVKDLKSIKNIQWLIALLAIFGLAFGIRIHEYCDRGYQPTQVKLDLK